MTNNVVQLRPPRPCVESQYQKYPLPFFDGYTLRTWNVTPTGDFAADVATGRRYAIEFLKSCDGTVGWVSLLPQIVVGMVGAGPHATFANGDCKVDGIVLGFASVLGRALCGLAMVVPMPEIVAMLENSPE